jgi:hypothetical protein
MNDANLAKTQPKQTQYVLQAKLAPGYMEERELVIDSAPLPSDILPCIAQPTTHELKSFGLLNKGFLSVGASVENSRVGRGRALRVSVASRNDASVDVDRVRVKLVELIEYHALEEKSSLKVELGKLKDIDLPGLDKTKGNGLDVRRKIRQGFERNVESTYRAIYQDLVSADNRFEVVVPETARDSYDGNLMTISHYLKVTFFTKALVENPSTKIPIVIGNPGDPERQPATPGRNPNEPIATVIFDEDIDLSADESQIEVGSRAEEPMAGTPMVDAVLLDQHQRLGMELPESQDPNATIVLGSENVIVCDDDSQSFFSAQEAEAPPTGSIPSAPDESLLRQRTTTARRAGNQNVHQPLGAQNHPPSPQRGAYSPYQMYTQQRNQNTEYSYDDSDYSSTITESDYRTPRAQGLLDRLIQELNGSIHDYEVIASKLRDRGCQAIFQTLTPKEYDRVLRNVSMNHQVKVACLLAKQINTFTCAHCAAAVAATSEYFRSNMVEALLPFCSDFHANRQVIEEGLSEWELIITRHAMENTAHGR